MAGKYRQETRDKAMRLVRGLDAEPADQADTNRQANQAHPAAPNPVHLATIERSPPAQDCATRSKPAPDRTPNIAPCLESWGLTVRFDPIPDVA